MNFFVAIQALRVLKNITVTHYYTFNKYCVAISIQHRTVELLVLNHLQLKVFFRLISTLACPLCIRLNKTKLNYNEKAWPWTHLRSQRQTMRSVSWVGPRCSHCRSSAVWWWPAWRCCGWSLWSGSPGPSCMLSQPMDVSWPPGGHKGNVSVVCSLLKSLFFHSFIT